MGMYTGLRVRAVIKPEYREEIELLHLSGYNWSGAKYDFMKNFGMDPRAEFIPKGAYYPVPGIHSWKKYCYYNSKTGLWRFACFLKNYNMTIENFLDDVLSAVAESATAEHKYEDSQSSIFLELENGYFVPKT